MEMRVCEYVLDFLLEREVGEVVFLVLGRCSLIFFGSLKILVGMFFYEFVNVFYCFDVFDLMKSRV